MGRIKTDGIFDRNPERFPNGYDHDVTLVKPVADEIIANVECPIPGADWISDDGLNKIRGEKASRIRLLGGDLNELSVVTNSKHDHCQVSGIYISLLLTSDIRLKIIGEALFNAGQKDPKTHRIGDVQKKDELSRTVRRCVLFRPPLALSDPRSHSGQALYSEKASRVGGGEAGPAVIGLLSFFHEALSTPIPVGSNMDDSRFQSEMGSGRVSFCAAFPIPDEVRENY